MATYTGTVGNDNLTGTDTADTFNLTQGGNDTARGLAGNDIFTMGATLNAADRIDGGLGVDTVSLLGDYSAGFLFAPATMVNVEALSLGAGFNYKLTTDDATVAAGTRLNVGAASLGSGNGLTFDGSHETDGFFSITGGAGNDVLTGGKTAGGSCDFFYLQYGGNDTANGRGGSDDFLMGGALNAADKINGGSGSDIVILDGDYSAGVTFNSTTMRNVELLWLNGGHRYSLTTADSTVAAGKTLFVNFPIVTGSGITGPLGPGDHLVFNGSAETNGSFVVSGSPGDDTLTGGARADEFYAGAYGGLGGGNDTMRGGAGGDEFFFVNGDFNASDYVNGGPGRDYLEISGDFSAGLTLSANDIKSVEQITIDDSGHPARITTTDDAVGSTGMEVVGPGSQRLVFNGSAETSDTLWIVGGSANDAIRTGGGVDWLEGNGGADRLRGGAGVDRYAYNAPSDSTSTRYDTIVGFNTHQDNFVFFYTEVKNVDPRVTHGALSTATFDHDLAAAVNSNHLHGHDAVIFTPTAGALAGSIFLVVDENGTPGYQASHDYVIRLVDPIHLADLNAYDDFLT